MDLDSVENEEKEVKTLLKPTKKSSQLKSKKNKVRFDGDKKQFSRTDKLAQPKQASQTYTYLLRDFAKFFEDERRLNIEQKISESSPKQNEQQIIENERKNAIRIERKQKAARKHLNKDQHDEIVQKILRKIAISISDPPRPMILGPNSRKLFNRIQSEIAVIVTPSTDGDCMEAARETVTKLSYAIMEFIRNARNEILEPAKVENTTVNISEIEVVRNSEEITEQIDDVEILKKASESDME